MPVNYSSKYTETAVLTSTPLELIRMLYRYAINSVQEARFCLQAGDVEGRSKPVGKALDALTELLLSLDHGNGGEIAHNLASLYGYIQKRVLDGHCEQSDAPFVEVVQLLHTLLESWEHIEAAQTQTETAAFLPQSSLEGTRISVCG